MFWIGYACGTVTGLLVWLITAGVQMAHGQVGHGVEFPEAVCRAALQAVGVEEPD